MFLQIALGELAAKIDLDTLAERAAMQEQTKVQEHSTQTIGAGTTQAVKSEAGG